MLNRRKLCCTMTILNGVLQPLSLALAFRPHPPNRISPERSIFPSYYRIIEGSLYRFHLFGFPRYTGCFGFSRTTCSNHGVSLACWNCGEPATSADPFLSCGFCRAVQPVDLSIDYFKIFGQEQKFELKGENLEGKYKEWQKKLHPDLVHSKSEKEKSYAAEQSARVIDAYRTLSEPLSRALYLLQLAGVLVDEEKIIVDPDLLAEMMDFREAVEEATDYKVLMELQCQLQRKHEEWSNSFRDAFNKRDFDTAISATQRMRYYERALEDIVNKL